VAKNEAEIQKKKIVLTTKHIIRYIDLSEFEK
jgi:hypothetical protein